MTDEFETDEIKVVSITPEINIPISLMNLADEIQKGEHGEVKNLTLVINEVATKNAHWNLACAVQKIQMLSLR
jgi:hypothetical protein